MRIWAISDTHSQHNTLVIPNNIDTVIHGGDCTNWYDIIRNQLEFNNFIDWFIELPIRYKVLIAGNHDAWAMKRYNIDKIKDLGIYYIEHEYLDLKDKLIFGSPYTPTFGQWYFMKDRSKLHQYWDSLNEGIDILITHGAPKSILDLSHDKNHKLEYCGDNALTKAIFKYKPKYHIFGHIHNSEDCYNSGIRILPDLNTTFINASVVTDNKFDLGCTSHGQVFEI